MYRIVHITEAGSKPLPKELAQVVIRAAAWYTNEAGENDFFVTASIDPSQANSKRLPTELILLSVLNDGSTDSAIPESLLALPEGIAPRVVDQLGGAPGTRTLILKGDDIPDNNERKFVVIAKF